MSAVIHISDLPSTSDDTYSLNTQKQNVLKETVDGYISSMLAYSTATASNSHHMLGDEVVVNTGIYVSSTTYPSMNGVGEFPAL